MSAAARRLLAEPDPMVRATGLELLRRTRTLERWMEQALRGPHRARIRAIEALGEVGDARALDALIAALGDDDGSIARAAATAVVKRDPDYAADRLAEALAHPHQRTAETAAAVLAALGEQAVEALIGQLSALSSQARRLAVACLGAIGSRATGDLLCPLLDTDPDPEVRAAVVEALARTGGDHAFAALQRVARSDPDWFVRARAHVLLGEAGAPSAREFLITSLAHLAAATGGNGDGRIEVVADGPARIRSAIIVGLRALGLNDREVAAALQEAELLRLMEGDALESSNGWTEVMAALQAPDPGGRAEAVRQLAEAGTRAVASLAAALEDPEPLVRTEAAHALGRLRATECLDALAACLRDPDPTVRLAASAALQRITAGQAARDLADL